MLQPRAMIKSYSVPKNKTHVIEDAATLAAVRGISLSELIVSLLDKEVSKFPNLLRDMHEYKERLKS